MFMILEFISCGGIDNIPVQIPNITSTVVTIIQIAVPIMLIIWGMLDFGKAVAAGKDDEIKNAQGLFIKRLIAAIVVFLVVVIVRFVLALFSDAEAEGALDCVRYFISGSN